MRNKNWSFRLNRIFSYRKHIAWGVLKKKKNAKIINNTSGLCSTVIRCRTSWLSCESTIFYSERSLELCARVLIWSRIWRSVSLLLFPSTFHRVISFFFKTSYSISNVSISRCHDEWIMVREIRIRTCHCGERACCNGFSLDNTTPFLSPVSRSFRILTSLPIAVSVWHPFSVRFPLYGPLLRSIRTARVISI